jgi:SpoVK/Ycf46/Vps4 family AAA+-type ATPase
MAKTYLAWWRFAITHGGGGGGGGGCCCLLLLFVVVIIGSGADIAALVREASLACLSDFLKDHPRDESNEHDSVMDESERIAAASLRVNATHFDVALNKILPSVSAEDELVYGQGFAARNVIPARRAMKKVQTPPTSLSGGSSTAPAASN